MSRTPAAELARLKVAYPAWTLRKIEQGKGAGFTAQLWTEHGMRSIYAPTLTGLESALISAHGTKGEKQ